jgi:multiple sugar transport system substrate-binding protein
LPGTSHDAADVACRGGIFRNPEAGDHTVVLNNDKGKAALDLYLKLAQVDGVPVHKAAYEHPMNQERRYRWMKPMAGGLPTAVNIYNFPEAAKVIAVLELGLNQAAAGKITAVAALNTMAEGVHKVMASKGYNTGKLEPLR